ncbi:glycosyltransferase [Cohnella thailandensis]|uniref:Glycosyltransferase n=1 Tax=Cohnella thailandensis TaxID=557557 RepID=A0A841T5B0_9BACL|nr:glycosyltransferase [Cohnella thailandensis]MBB6638159.1 glycosyltransferase [Cohnella thailandensis]MBP1971916.1 glycosyltransferase involved in cell wall biosynthesis [Cohnella thailandensis]
MKKRVLHLLSSNSYSGAESVAFNIIKSFEESYYSVYVSPEGPIEDQLKHNNIPYIPLKKMNPFYVSRIIREWKPDIIHAHDFRASIVSAASIHNCHVVSHIHQNPHWLRKLNPFTLLYMLSAIRYKNIIFVSKAIEREAIFTRLVKNRLHIVPNYVDIEDVIEKSKLNNDTLVSGQYDLAFIGRLVDVKDPLQFIQIVKAVASEKKNVRAVMVGEGDLKGQCTELIDRLELNSTIDMVGFQRNPYSIISNSKIVVMTSKYEGFGLVAIEAMALGKPVFCSHVGGLKDTIVDNICIINVDDPTDSADSIIKVLSNDQLYNTISSAVEQRIMENNSKDRWKSSITRIYEDG